MTVFVDMGKRSDRLSVALPREISERARELSALASKHGWSALGVDRDDPPTITAIFEEAINVLASRAKVKSNK
jgi:hypothetical protein